MKLVPIFIKWIDAANLDKGWHDLESASAWANLDHSMVQYGFLIKETKEYILVAGIFTTRGDKFRSLFRIPKGWILEMRKLKE